MQPQLSTTPAAPAPAPVFDVNAPALNPFTSMKTAQSSSFTFKDGLATAILGIAIPAGKRLAVQYIAIDVATQSSESVLVHFTTSSTAAGSTSLNDHQLLLTPVPVGGGNVQWIGSGPVAFYADGPSASFTIGVQAADAATLGTVNVNATVSGYLVTA